MYLSETFELMKKESLFKRLAWKDNGLYIKLCNNGDNKKILVIGNSNQEEISLYDMMIKAESPNIAQLVYEIMTSNDFVEFTSNADTKETPCNFDRAFKLMKKGYKVKLPSWGGYWYWDDDKKTIIIHTKDNKELDIRETDKVEYTTLNILSDEWIVADETNCPELGGVAEFSFSEALKYLKRGMKVARKGWHKNNMYLTMQFPDENSKMTNPYIYINVTDNYRIPWTASQADMFEEDWVFVNEQT